MKVVLPGSKHIYIRHQSVYNIYMHKDLYETGVSKKTKYIYAY